MRFVTNNDLKFEAASKAINKKIKQVKIDINEIQSDPRSVSIEKAKSAYKKINKRLFINDSCLVIPSLNDFPGSYTKYIEQTIGDVGILKLMDGIKDRTCYYLDNIVYIDKYIIKEFTYKTMGKIALKTNNDNFYPLDKIFIKDGDTKPVCYTDNNAYTSDIYNDLNVFLNKRRVSRGITFFDDKVLLLHRIRNIDGEFFSYYAIPGGGIDRYESIDDACIRELNEEASINVNIEEFLGFDEYENGLCYYFLTKYQSGEVKLGGEELEQNNPNNFYELEFIDINDLDNIFIFGLGKEMIKKAYKIYKEAK